MKSILINHWKALILTCSVGVLAFVLPVAQAAYLTIGSTQWNNNGTSIYNNNTGNVGIGTSTPADKLHIVSTGNTFVNLMSGVGLSSGLEMTQGTGYGYNIYSNDTGSGAKGLNVDRVAGGVSTNALFIDTARNVGIGTTIPAVKLDVNGGTGNALNMEGGFVYGLNSTPVNNDQAVPLGYLKSNYAPLGSGTGSAFVQGGNSFGAAAILGTNDNYPLNFETNNTTQMTVLANGNVGIGTANPNTAGLVVIASSSAGAAIDVNNNHIINLATPMNPTDAANKSYVDSSLSSATSSITLWGGTTGGNIWNLNSSGNVGIGTTNPVAKFDLLSNVSANADTYGIRSVLNFTEPDNNSNYMGYGGYFEATDSNTASTGDIYGVYGSALNSNGYSFGVYGVSADGDGIGVKGHSSNGYGVIGESITGYGGYFNSTHGYGLIAYTYDAPAALFASNASSTEFAIYASSGKNYFAGNVGIGTTNPGYRLDAYTPNTSDAYYRFERQDTTQAVGISLANSTIDQWRMYMPASSTDLRFYNGGDRMTVTSAGNVGIRTTVPNDILTVSSPTQTLNAENPIIVSQVPGYTRTSGIYNTIDTLSGLGTGILFKTYKQSVGSYNAMKIMHDGSVGIGTTTPQATLDVNGLIKMRSSNITQPEDVINKAYLSSVLTAIATTTSGVTQFTGNLNMGGYNITNVGKITVTTIDPLYNINKINYSTFASAIAGGVKEETVGKIKVAAKTAAGDYQAVIDFNHEPVGSDLWVWHKIVDFNADNVEVLLTPYNSFAQAYYSISGESLTIHTDRPATIAYRLIGKRLDWRQWPTKALNQTETASFIIK